ncbi:GNAT family N-acetyltransferase [Spongiimicrobium sp. 2-473A-2-J]|uniref:GNAT family N-acetyltransferase n=1 Tax=Eudoraea algarum TaxID=3417568 RepID=UPI003D367F2B
MKAFESIETSRTVIRRLMVTDKEKLIALLGNTNITANMAFPDEMKTAEGAANLLKITIASYGTESPLLAYAIQDKNNSRFLGVTGLNPMKNKEIEIFYALLPENWNKGLATEVMDGLTEFILNDGTYQVVLAFITQNNKASMRVAEKNGFSNYGLVTNQNFKDLVFLYKKERNPS